MALSRIDDHDWSGGGAISCEWSRIVGSGITLMKDRFPWEMWTQMSVSSVMTVSGVVVVVDIGGTLIATATFSSVSVVVGIFVTASCFMGPMVVLLGSCWSFFE